MTDSFICRRRRQLRVLHVRAGLNTPPPGFVSPSNVVDGWMDNGCCGQLDNHAIGDAKPATAILEQKSKHFRSLVLESGGSVVPSCGLSIRNQKWDTNW